MSMKEFDKIIGYTSIKRELEQIADTLKNGEAYAKLGVSAPKGLLLHGEPGVGKTLMATSLIEASGRKAFVCRKDQPDGDFVKTIKETFDRAAANAPSIVFLDDMDKFANGDERHTDEEEYVTVQSCIDTVKGKGVFVLATANDIRSLPKSLRRAGRFDRIIDVKAPVGRDAVQIIEHYLKGKPFVGDIDAKTVARILNGRSCAELETVINEAGLCAGFARSEQITMEHFMEACLRTLFDVEPKSPDEKDEDWLADLPNGEKRSSQIVYHEAGHAVLFELLAPESVTLVSAHGRSGASGGFTRCYHPSDTNPMRWDICQIVGGLGGKAALDQKFGIADLGCSRDLDQVFDMVYDHVTDVCTHGFSLYRSDYGSSDTQRAAIEQVVAAEVERYYRKAREILALNREFLDKVAAELAQKRLLHMVDIQRIKAECRIVPVSI